MLDTADNCTAIVAAGGVKEVLSAMANDPLYAPDVPENGVLFVQAAAALNAGAW